MDDIFGQDFVLYHYKEEDVYMTDGMWLSDFQCQDMWDTYCERELIIDEIFMSEKEARDYFKRYPLQECRFGFRLEDGKIIRIKPYSKIDWETQVRNKLGVA